MTAMAIADVAPVATLHSRASVDGVNPLESGPLSPAGRDGGYAARGRLGTRALSLLLTLALHLAVLGALVVRWQVTAAPIHPAEPLTIEMLPLAAPPEPVREVPEGPRKTEQQARRPKEKRPDPLPIVRLKQAAATPVTEQPEKQAEATVPVPETTAPKALPAPPATRPSNNAERTWEALLLAHLEKYRRYPPAARSRRQQGVALVRFRMSRAGRVLSAALVRTSGSPLLDQAAVDTLTRAQPLPRIPDDRPDELDLTVPVEFFIGG